ncbi:MAG: hypothetical protein AB200_00210 [Parcubacteria bacterium C7867-005]|nr:MAG: hypothetical protein AB200_00210 [Parcubacteria bacterium C7867-005]
MSKFQIILLSVFGIFIVAAVLLFSLSRGSDQTNAKIVVWGSIPTYDFDNFLNTSGITENKTISIDYVEKSKDSFDTQLTEALAVGGGPDLVILPVSKIWKNRNKLILIPKESVSPQVFTQTFIEEGELLMTDAGAYALPILVDPLVLYWNRDIFSGEALVAPPVYWDEIYSYAERFLKKDNAGNIQQSAIALGETKNIPNAKSILSLLLLQAGTDITGFVGGELRSVLGQGFNLPLVPSHAALDFYTQFSNPAKPFYSWNQSLLSAQTTFTSGDSAMYLGFASELPLIKAKSPTLNLGISKVLQSRVSGKTITFGDMYAVAIVRNTRNPQASLAGAFSLISKENALELSKIMGLAPARRDLLAEKPTDESLSVFYDAAIQSRGWVDPDDRRSSEIFIDMIEAVTSGRARTQEAVNKANDELEALINQ